MQKLVLFLLKRARKGKGKIGVEIIGDAAMRRLNRVHRGIDRPTDVLSFATSDGPACMETDDLGDVHLSVPHIRRQAKRFDVPFEEEFYRSLAHGVLHLLSFDHVDPREAERMWRLQERAVTYAQTL